jgi:hypothetical protein
MKLSGLDSKVRARIRLTLEKLLPNFKFDGAKNPLINACGPKCQSALEYGWDSKSFNNVQKSASSHHSRNNHVSGGWNSRHYNGRH